jgi:hypothetical protein
VEKIGAYGICGTQQLFRLANIEATRLAIYNTGSVKKITIEGIATWMGGSENGELRNPE